MHVHAQRLSAHGVKIGERDQLVVGNGASPVAALRRLNLFAQLLLDVCPPCETMESKR